jgi:hypothetical protein
LAAGFQIGIAEKPAKLPRLNRRRAGAAAAGTGASSASACRRRARILAPWADQHWFAVGVGYAMQPEGYNSIFAKYFAEHRAAFIERPQGIFTRRHGPHSFPTKRISKKCA